MKKYLRTLFIGLVLVLVGGACFYIETVKYDINPSLTTNFGFEQNVIEYEINNNEIFKITNDGTDKNMNLFIDNTLDNEVRIVIEHVDIMNVNSKYNSKKHLNQEIINVDVESDIELNWDAIIDLYNLGLASLKNNTMYNYSLLKYPEVKVFVNEKNRSNIEFVDKYGKEYNPIG